ncbi:hypothetical protein B0T14DRAFT_551183 [Immersiella caudata]|uniref:Uncharacterized protein n=1 Tax=Immersiella caudata TaxID=314043 RepID=A0AA39XI92_9PEZI|nr:hypothetical protein B0T14DRAFT_551183 [Immersiella caudata]
MPGSIARGRPAEEDFSQQAHQSAFLLNVNPPAPYPFYDDGQTPQLKPSNSIDFHSLWIWEILSFSAGGILYGIFFYLLFRYDGQLVSQWEQNSPISGLFRTLQSAVSLITTIMKAAMLLPLASAMGQLKWHYARHPSRLKDIELIDGASRGNLGAVRLLFSRSAIHSTSIGCLIIISAVLLGPFIQNTVQVRTQIFSDEALPPDTVPLLPVTKEIVTSGPDLAPPNGSSIGLSMFSSIQAAWAAAASSVDFQGSRLTHKCPFDFCEWTNFTTLGVASQCRAADVATPRHPTTGVLYAFSNEADVDNLTNATRLSDGTVVVNEWLTRLRLLARETIPERSGYAELGKTLPLILHLSALGYYNGSYQATECVLYWAALHYEWYTLNITAGGVDRGRWREFHKTSSNVSRDADEVISIDGVDFCRFNASVEACKFTVDPASHQGVRGLLVPFLNDDSVAYPREMTNDMAELRALDFSKPRIELFYGDWTDRVFEMEDTLTNQTGRFMKMMAVYMTNNIRSNSGRYVFGRGASVNAYFAINKRYAAYPTVIFAASILFVSVTAWRARRERIWKNSALALLFNGLEQAPIEDGENFGTLAGMESVAERMVVRLDDEGDGLGLKLRTG